MVFETSGAGSAGGRGEWDREEEGGNILLEKLLFLLFILKSYPDCSSFESSGFLSSLQLSFSVLICVKCKNNTRSKSSMVHCS